MALTSIEIVRLGIGDIKEPYVFTDDQIQHYLTINSDDTDAAIDDLQPIMSATLAVNAVSIKTEDLHEDNRDAAKRYNESLNTASTLKGNNCYPIIGGGEYRGTVINQFDEENDYDDEDTFYNGYEDI